MHSGDATTSLRDIPFLKPEGLPHWCDREGDVRHRVAITTIDGVVLYAVLEAQSEVPETVLVEDGGEPPSAATVDCTHSQAPSSPQAQETLLRYDDALEEFAAALQCAVHRLVVQFTPDTQVTDPGKTFRDSVLLLNPVKLTVALAVAQWRTIQSCLESLSHHTAYLRPYELTVMFLDHDTLSSNIDGRKALQRSVMSLARDELVGHSNGPNVHFTSVHCAAVVTTGAGGTVEVDL